MTLVLCDKCKTVIKDGKLVELNYKDFEKNYEEKRYKTVANRELVICNNCFEEINTHYLKGIDTEVCSENCPYIDSAYGEYCCRKHKNTPIVRLGDDCYFNKDIVVQVQSS